MVQNYRFLSMTKTLKSTSTLEAKEGREKKRKKKTKNVCVDFYSFSQEAVELNAGAHEVIVTV